MYSYTATGTIFDGVSNIYMLSTVTVFLAVIIALYCANFLKDENPDSIKVVYEETYEEEWEDEGLLNDREVSAMEENFLPKEEINRTSDTQTIKKEKEMRSYQRQNKTTQKTNEEEVEVEAGEIAVDGSPLSDGLVGKFKTARMKQLEAQLSIDQLKEERRIEREQLAAIFELLKKQESELNMKEIDEGELMAQLNLYR